MIPLITDNFLKPDDFKNLQMLMLGEDLPWYYMDKIDYPDDDHDPDKFQFTHAFYGGDHIPITVRLYMSNSTLLGILIE